MGHNGWNTVSAMAWSMRNEGVARSSESGWGAWVSCRLLFRVTVERIGASAAGQRTSGPTCKDLGKVMKLKEPWHLGTIWGLAECSMYGCQVRHGHLRCALCTALTCRVCVCLSQPLASQVDGSGSLPAVLDSAHHQAHSGPRRQGWP